MTLLARYDTPYGNIQIREGHNSINYYQNGYWMSSINSDNYKEAHGYNTAIQEAIKDYKSVLILGCAGGTLANMLPNATTLDLVDINPVAFEIAKKWFKLTPKANCIVSCAADYLASSSKLYDAIVIDVFDGQGRIPDKLVTKEFFNNVIKLSKHTFIINHCFRIGSKVIEDLTGFKPVANHSHCYFYTF